MRLRLSNRLYGDFENIYENHKVIGITITLLIEYT